MGWSKLDAFARAALPTLVVSCKCDAPRRQLNPNSIEQVGIVGGYDTMQTSSTSPDSQKKCLAAILSMIARKNGSYSFIRFLFFSFLLDAQVFHTPLIAVYPCALSSGGYSFPVCLV